MPTTNNLGLLYGEYLRKSTDDKEKQVLSLSSQRDVLDKLQQRHTLTIVTTIEEKMSAKRPGRPGFARLLKEIKTGNINAIVTWAPHRLSRNSVDIGEIIHLFDTGYLKEIVTESHTYRNNPMDIFMLGFHCLQAKFENDNKALDVKGGMRKCASLGIFPGCPPLGYLPDKGGIKGARKRDIDPIVFPLIQHMWEYILTGQYTPQQILTIATNQWGLRSRRGSKLSLSMIYSIFYNPFYTGEFEWPRKSGNWYKGTHKPMVSKLQFDTVQRMLKKPDRTRPSKHYFPFGGCILHCGVCGCAISATEKIKRQKNGNVHTYHYYFCTKKKAEVQCNQPPVTENELDRHIENILRDISIPSDMHNCIMKAVRFENQKQFGKELVHHEANKEALISVERKQNNLIDMRAGGLISDEQYREKTSNLKDEERRLLTVIASTDEAIAGWIDTAEKLFTFTEMAIDRFRNGGPEMKRSILIDLGWNLSLKEKQLDFSREKWITPVKKLAHYIKSNYYTSGPFLTLKNKGKSDKLVKDSIVCSLLHEVRTSFTDEVKKHWREDVLKWNNNTEPHFE